MIETTSLTIYRAFGGASVAADVPCRFTNQFNRAISVCPLTFTHAVEVDDTVDIRDGCTRTAGNVSINFADGDEVRITGGGLDPATRFVVVWVDRIINAPGQAPKKIAYLLRHSAAWPGP